MGWSFFDRQRAAETFLSTGSAAAQAAAGFTPLNPFDDFITPNTSDYRYGKCWDNSNCAAGFYCVGGQCVQNNTAGNLGGTQNPGDCSEPVYDCGRNLGCAKPKCIETSVDDCCNDERCCRYASTGVNGPTTGLSVQCYCGPCPSPNKCNQWCDSYLKTIGKYLPSCNRDNTCTECADCIGGAGPSTCLLDTFNPPCHCDENQCGECESCDRETGNCYSDAKKCKFCKNFFPKCPGQEFIEEAITICKDNPSISDADIEYWYEKNCPPKEEVCKTPGVSSIWCDDSQDPQPPCPPNTYCKNTGTISAGGATCYLRTDYNLSGIPQGCSECSNNSDCGDCEVCELYESTSVPGVVYYKCVEAQACSSCTYDVYTEMSYRSKQFALGSGNACGVYCIPEFTVNYKALIGENQSYEVAKAWKLEYRTSQRDPGLMYTSCGDKECFINDDPQARYILPNFQDGTEPTSGVTQEFRAVNAVTATASGWVPYEGCYGEAQIGGPGGNQVCLSGGNPRIVIVPNCPNP